MKITSLNQLDLPNQVKPKDLKKGFIVQVYEKKVSILVDCLYSPEKEEKMNAGFFELNCGAGNLNTRSKDVQTVLARVLDGPTEIELFYFDCLSEFANAVLSNNWRLYTEE